MASDTCYEEVHNCSDVDDLVKLHYLPVAYSIIFVVGLVGNVTSISIYLTKLRPWKSNSIIMVNLALTDLLYVLSMPFLAYYYHNGDSWMLGEFMCLFVRFGFHFNLYGSILFLTCLAIFRYVVVLQPLKAAQVQRKTWGIVACLAVWVIAAAEIAPMLTMISLEECNNKTYCLDFASNDVKEIWVYSWLLTVLGFLVPLGVVFLCYIGIVRQLAKGPNTTSPCRTRARRLSVLILVLFIVCFLPYHILRVARIENRRMNDSNPVIHAAYIISRPLAAFNTFFNLALYTLSGDNFRRAFLNTFHIERWLTKARSLIHVAIISDERKDVPAR